MRATVAALVQLLKTQSTGIVATAVDDDARLSLARELGADYAEGSTALAPVPAPAAADSCNPIHT